MDAGGTDPADRYVEGVVEMMLDATQNFGKALTADRLFGWQAALFPTGRSGMRKIIVGAWRGDLRGPMQIVSGPVGKEKVHYEAPAASLLENEMARFLAWANGSDRTDAVLRAALAHLWFVTIHPFDDGNGRIARAIADWQLARSEKALSASTACRRRSVTSETITTPSWSDRRRARSTSRRGCCGSSTCLGRAFDGTEMTLAAVLRKARFWERSARLAINERQRAILNRLLDGFTGNLTTQKWATLAKCSHDTALRDIQGLIDQGLLKKDAGGGRSTSYSLNEDSWLPGD